MADEKIVLEGRSRRAIERIGHFGPTKIRLDESVDEVTRKITKSYARAWQVVRGEVRETSRYAAEQMHADNGMSARDVARLDRVDRAFHALERQVRDLDRFTGVEVLGGANRRFRHDVDQIVNTLAELTGVDRRFTAPSGAAIEAIVLRSTGRIESAVRRLDADQATALKDGLLRGLVYGDSPQATAKRIYDETQGAFFGGLPRARTLARTELADAQRYATNLAYTANEMVVGWKWLASLSPRTCPACWAMHNSLHPKSEPQYGHANCRCTQVPVLADDVPEDHDLGNPEEIFWGLPREEQLQIMGPGRLKALEAGVRFSDLTYLNSSTDWRPAQVVTRVSDLAGLAELNVATFPGDVIEIPGQTNSSVMSMAYAQGGMTVHALTGEQPTSGFVVARRGTSEVIDAREFFGPAGPATMAAWMRRHGDRLDEPGAHVGMWYDTANGKVVLDVVEILKDREAAIALGRAEDQIAIFDLDTFAEIPTGGTGGYAEISDALGQADIGREAVITRKGPEEFTSGTVVAAGDWGIRIKTSDGEFINAAPGQFFFESSHVQSNIDRINQVQKIVATADHGVPVDYTGADPKAAQEMDDALDDLRGDWPKIMPKRVETAKLNGEYGLTTTRFNMFTGSFSEALVQVERENAADYRAWSEHMSTPESTGHFHRGTADEPAEYTVDHEFGHVLHHTLAGHPETHDGNLFMREVMADVYTAIGRDLHERGEGPFPDDLERVPSFDPAQVPDAWNQGLFSNEIAEDLSYYATSSPAELIAEGFAVYRDHGPGESVVADTVMKKLVNAYLEKFGEMPEEEAIDQLLDLAQEVVS